jgi:hypothetical protein
MAESETKADGSAAAITETAFNSMGDILDEEGLARAVEGLVQPQAAEPESEPEPTAEAENTENEQSIGEPEDSDLSQDDDDELDDNSGQSRGVQKRIDKLTRRYKEAEQDADSYRTKLGELESEVANLKEGQSESAPVSENPYSNKTTARELEKAEEEAEDWIEWCEDNPDGGDREGREYDLDEVRQIRKAARKALRSYIPNQKDHIKAARHYEPIANDMYPFWKKPVSAEFKVAQEFVQAVPAIKRFPDYKVIVGDYLYGRYMREQAVKKKSSPEPKKAPPQPVAPSAAPKAEKTSDRQRQAQLNQFHRSEGSVNDLASILGATGLVKG